MKLTMKLSLGFGCLLLIAVAFGCGTTKSGSYTAPTNVVSDVQEFDVDGIHVIMRQAAETPVVTAILYIRGGDAAVPPDEPVSSEYFTMKVVTAGGTQNISKAYFRRKLVRMGTGIGGENGRDYSALSLKCTRESFDTSWAYFTDIILHPQFDQTEFDNFKQSVLLGLSSRMIDPESYSTYAADSIYFQGHPYGKMYSVEDVQRETISLLQAHFKELMQKARFVLSVVGNISRKELTDKIESSIASLPQGSYTPVDLSVPVKAYTPGAYFPPFARRLPTDYIVGYYLAPSKGDHDYYPYLRLRNFFGGFVFNHIRVQHNLAYAPNVDDREGRISNGMITLQTPYVDSAIKIIYDDVDFFQRNRIRESAIREGVAGWATRNYMNAETTEQQAVFLGQAVLETGDWHNAFFSYEKLASVTSDELVAAANKYLKNFNWVVIGDTTGIDKSLLLSR